MASALLLLDVMYRSLVRQGASWDLLAIIIGGGQHGLPVAAQDPDRPFLQAGSGHLRNRRGRGRRDRSGSGPAMKRGD